MSSLYNAANNRIETRHRCESVQSKKSSADNFWSNTSDRQTVCSPREWETEEDKSVMYNFMTTICRSYIWACAAAALLVEMMQKQSKADFSSRLWYSFQTTGWDKGFCLQNMSPGLHEETDLLITLYMHKHNHGRQKHLTFLVPQCKTRSTPWNSLYLLII